MVSFGGIHGSLDGMKAIFVENRALLVECRAFWSQTYIHHYSFDAAHVRNSENQPHIHHYSFDAGRTFVRAAVRSSL